MTEVVLRAARAADVRFLVELFGHMDVAPFLAVSRSRDTDEVAAEIARGEHEPDAFGVLVIEVDGSAAGTVTWELVNRRSRIVAVSGLALEPGVRGRGLGAAVVRALSRLLLDELGFHRLQMEVYAFNERALRHAESAGWIREGVRRKAYLRDGAWIDGVLFGLVADDLAGAE